MDPGAENVTMEVYQHFVDDILNLVANLLIDNNLMQNSESNNDFNKDFFYNPLLANNVHNIKEMEFAFNLSIKRICDLPNGFIFFR